MVAANTTSLSLIDRARRREKDAWTRLSRLYAPLVYGWVRNSGVSEHDAVDLVQDVFTAVVTSVNDYTPDRGRFRAWLRGITRHKLGDHFRKAQSTLIQSTGMPLSGLIDDTPEFAGDSDGDDPELPGIVQRAVELVRSGVEERTWQAFWQTAIEGQPTAEVAESLGLSCDSVRQSRSRILRRLREELSQEF